MSQVLIQKFQEKDIKQIAHVMKEAFTSIGQNWSDETSEKYIRDYFHYSCCYQANVGEKVVGFIIANNESDHVFIDSIGVLLDYRSQGIAKKLWKQAGAHAAEHKLPEIKLISDPKSEAYQWYLKLGLQETGWVEMAVELKNQA